MAETTKFFLKNNDVRSHGFAGKTCIAGAGNPTPPEAAKQIMDGQPFSLPPKLELSESEMFKSYRGILATMKAHTREGRPAIEVFVNGLADPLKEADLESWAAEYRAKKGLVEPKTRVEHVREVEYAMARAEDPIEVERRARREEEQKAMTRAISATVIEMMAARQASPENKKPEEAPRAERSRPRP